MRPRRGLLVATNLLLAGGISLAVLSAGADAFQPGNRARGQYTMVAGEVQGGGSASAVYISDSVNQELVVVRWNNSRRELDGIDFRDLDTDLNRRPGR